MKRVIIAGLTLLCTLGLSAQKKNTDWARYYRYEQKNSEVSSRPAVVFMGDSITDNWYRDDAEFFDSHNFLCRGISGQVTSQMLCRFRNDVLELKPQYVVILAGINDIAENNGPIKLENVMRNLMSMCELAKAHKIKPILCSVLPCNRLSWRPEKQPADDVIQLNEMIKEYASANKIPYVDYWTALADDQKGLSSQMSKDGCHPKLDCYKMMEEIILKALKTAR